MKLGMFFAVWVAVLTGCNAPVATPAPDVPQTQERRVDPRDTGSHERASGTAGAFDYYLLTLSWSPEYCVSHQQAAECAAHPVFVLHGLWPENVDGSYPQHCSNAPGPTNPGLYHDIFPDAGLLKHEWQTHGTCSGLSPDAYFAAARNALKSVAIPQDLATLKSPVQRKPGDILSDFAQANPSFRAGSFAVSCGNNRLTAVEVCVDKNLQAVACQGVRSCRANIVKVTPPGATSDQ